MQEITDKHPDVTEAFTESFIPGEEVLLSFESTNHDSFIVDAAGNHVASHEEIHSSLPTDNKSEAGRLETLPFANCYYTCSDARRIPIDSLTVRYDMNVENETTHILGDESAKAIMKDVMSGNLMFFGRDSTASEKFVHRSSVSNGFPLRPDRHFNPKDVSAVEDRLTSNRGPELLEKQWTC